MSPNESSVTIVVPWLELESDRAMLYGDDWKEATPDDQEAYIRKWLAESANLPQEAAPPSQGGIAIQWYPARYHPNLSSIFAMGDLVELAPPDSSEMICIMEEPEHINFYKAPGKFNYRDKFAHVVGIIHTNYKAYAMNSYMGIFTGPFIAMLSSILVWAYCDKVVKLSPVLQDYAPYKEVVSNVHGIREEFFHVPQRNNPDGTKRIYFIGKLLWAKGLDKLLELQGIYRKATGDYFAVDIVGSGPEQEAIQKSFLGREFLNQGRIPSASSFLSVSNNSTNNFESPDEEEKKECTAEISSVDAKSRTSIKETSNTATNAAKRYWRRFRQPIPARFLGRQDHASIGENYQIFINPSITEVLCTTTAEAIAMGKWVIIPKHSSNEFFLPFGNCLQYSDRKEFVELLQHCLENNPPGWLETDEDRSKVGYYEPLSWEAATERLVENANLSKRDSRRCVRLQPTAKARQDLQRRFTDGEFGDVVRTVMFGGPVAKQVKYMKESSSMSNLSLPSDGEKKPEKKEGEAEAMSPTQSSASFDESTAVVEAL